MAASDRRLARHGVVVLAAAWLAACSSPRGAQAPVVDVKSRAVGAAPAVAAAPGTAPASASASGDASLRPPIVTPLPEGAGTVVTPLSGPPSTPPPNTALSPDRPAAPRGDPGAAAIAVPPGVAARFPEPATDFATPAFTPGRQAFTSNDELSAIVHGLERSAAVGERGTDVRVLRLGASQAGVPIEALAFSRPAPPAAAGSAPAPARRPSVVVVAAQHGDEPAGTEALVVVAQELAGGRLAGVLDRVDVVLVPRANPDGAAAFSRNAADGTDVNRDHLLLRSPEARALTRLMNEVAPVVVLDLHEYPVGGAFTATFGAIQRFDALLQYAMTANVAPFVTKAAEEWFRLPLVASLRGAGLSSEWYATSSAVAGDRTLTMGSVGPQVGRNANGLRNAVSLLVETRGGGLGRTDLKRRVQAHVVAVTSVLDSAATHAGDLAKLRQYVDREIAALACQGEVVIEAAPTPSEYAYSMLDGVSGEIRRLTVAWESALRLRVVKSRPRPCGYWLAASEGDAVQRLRLLGIDVLRLDEPGELRGETYRESGREPVGAATPAGAAANAGATTRLQVRTTPALLDVGAGGYYVPLEQPLAHLAVAALEPEAPASFAANGVIADVANEARILLRPATRMTAVP